MSFFNPLSKMDCKNILIAYSGGIDSTVLLHHLIETQPKDRLRAIHINHALYPESDVWQAHCENTCRLYGIDLICCKLTEKPSPGDSIEAWARDQRHRIFREHLQPNEVLMTAQHADDQAETVLLQLLRGAGPKGLSAMPIEKPFGRGSLVRPLLTLNKQMIVDYAHEHQLTWVTDHSNSNAQFDRNFLRETIIPLLKQRWPALAQTLSRSASHCAAQQDLLDQLLTPIYSVSMGSKLGTLSIKALQQQPPLIARALVRYWLNEKQFPMPGHKKFEKIFDNVIPARPDAQPEIVWGEVCIRRYRDDLYALHLTDIPEPGARRTGRKKEYQEKAIPPWERILKID